MTQQERLAYLVEEFKADSGEYRDLQTPADVQGKRRIVGEVGRFIVAVGHTGVEHGFADGVFLFAKGVTVEHGSVSQGYKSLALALCFPLKFFVHDLLVARM